MLGYVSAPDSPMLLQPSVHVALNVIPAARKLDIMDNMLNMMEKYANNLEEIVTQRTAELTDEKKKTDRLLYSMLPRYASQTFRVLSIRPF